MTLTNQSTEDNTILSPTILESGLAFLKENKKRHGVEELSSGLQYEIIKQGSGVKPKIFHDVTCHYVGKLVDGTIFDSSINRGQPATFPVNMVIRGWTEALQMMPLGSKWRLYIPPHLAYGDRQVGSIISPNSTLIFEIELLGIS